MKYLVNLIILWANVAAYQNLSASYSPNIGTIGWQLSNVAYCSDSEIQGWNCKNCRASGIILTNISTLSNKGCRAFVGYEKKDNAIYVSFMGSQNIQDWIDNLDFIKIKYPSCSGCEVHTGFWKAYKNLAPGIQTTVKNLRQKYNGATLRIFGHSLGAAEAVHCAADMIMTLKFPPEYVYTYGQPRVGEKNFANWYSSVSKNHFRLTHGHDIVPHLPLQSMNFYHTAEEIFYAKNPPNYKVCDGSGEDNSCSDQYAVDLSINDHLTYMGGTCCCS